ncbi:MAG: hypothetical protein EB075_15170 [Bacteroidetes bacterium]|nr:hypothetical protein [Bacteroidota bacterium]
MQDTLATEHQISDGVGVLITAAPFHGLSLLGAHPNHALLAPKFADLKGVAHVACPYTAPGIELIPGGRLNGDGTGHGSFAC